MLGESPTDSAAIRASQSLSTDGIAELVWPVNLPAGTTRLYCGLGGVDYEVVRITISP
jgi:hypothetical protein